MKKIVAVQFEDGTVASVDDMQVLAQYIHDFNMLKNLRALAADKSIDWPAVSASHEERQASLLQKKATKRKNAAQPRKKSVEGLPITKADLVAFEEDWRRRNPGKRGVVKATCLSFGITAATRKKRLAK